MTGRGDHERRDPEYPKKASESVEKEEVNFGEGWKASPPVGKHIQRGFSAQA